MARKKKNSLGIVVHGKTQFLPVQTFLEAAADTIAILEELDKSISGDERGTVRWGVIDAHKNSPMTLEFASEQQSPIDISNNIIDSYFDGIRQLNEGRGVPRHFTTRALRSAERMANLYDNGAGKIEFFSPTRNAVMPLPVIAKNVKLILEAPATESHSVPLVAEPSEQFVANGSLEGRVATLVARDTEYFNLIDSVTEANVKCEFDDSIKEDVRLAWDKRVRVTGIIHYSRPKRVPLRIEVDQLRLLRGRHELPQFDTEHIDITGGIDPVEYVRGLRDDD